MANLVTKDDFSKIFKLMLSFNSSEKTQQNLLELQQKTEDTFKKSRKDIDLNRAVEKAIKIVSEEHNQDISSKILSSVAPIIMNKKFKTAAALGVVVTAFVGQDLIEEALKAADEISDKDAKMQSLYEIINRVIQTEDLEKALNIIDDGNITDEAMESELREKIINECIHRDNEDDMELAISAAKGITDSDEARDRSLIKIINFLSKKGELKQAIETLDDIRTADLLAKTVIGLAKFLNEKDTKSVIDLVNKFKDKNDTWLLDTLEKFGMALLDVNNMVSVMKVADSLTRGSGDPERVSDILSRLCKKFIEKDHTDDYIVKLVDYINDLNEDNSRKASALTLGIIKTLKKHGKHDLAAKVRTD